jgi:hypothetical protein
MVERTEYMLSKFQRRGYYKIDEFCVEFDKINEEKGSRIEDCVENIHKELFYESIKLMAGPQKE